MVNSSILHGIREVPFVIGLFTVQRVGWIIRLIIKVEPIFVRVLLEQEVLVVQSGFHIRQEHINGSLVFGFNKVLLGHMLNRGVGLYIACNGKNPMRHVAPNLMGDTKPESKLTRQLLFIKLAVWSKPNQVVEFKVATLADAGFFLSQEMCSPTPLFVS